MTPTFIDANVPIYAAGKAHSLKVPCAEILAFSAEHPDRFVTDAEVLQELLHRYLALRLWPMGRGVVQRFEEIMSGRVEPVVAADVLSAADMAGRRSGTISARDLLHAAVMKRVGAASIVTADAGFERIAGITRYDPATWPSWKGLVARE